MEDDDLPSLETLMPILRPWDRQALFGARISRLLFEGDVGSPLVVFYGHSTPRRNLYLTAGHLLELGIERANLEAICIRNWLVRYAANLHWESLDLAGDSRSGLVITGEDDLVSGLLLAEGHLKGLHQYFGERVLHLAVPDNFTVMVHPNSAALLQAASERHEQMAAERQGMSPHLLASYGGQLHGYTLHRPKPTPPKAETGRQEAVAVA